MNNDYKEFLADKGNISGKIDYLKTAIRNNKDAAIALGGSVLLQLVSLSSGKDPFSNYDKIAHTLFGYAMSRTGRKIAKIAGKQEYGNWASLAMCLGTGLSFELLELNEYTSNIAHFFVDKIFTGKKSVLVFDGFDVAANLAGSVAENIYQRT